MATTQEWRDVERQILNGFDVVEAYRQMGVKIPPGHTTAKGWREVHAIDRLDGDPSAAIGADWPVKGRYRDMGGDGLSLNLWEFGRRFGGFPTWQEARKHFANQAGVKLPAGAEPRRPDDQIEFLPSEPNNGLMISLWCEAKGGFTPEAVLDNGGILGSYPKRARAENSQYVIAFPGWPGSIHADPCAWVVADSAGGLVKLYRGAGKLPTEHKTLSVGGSTGGLLGTYGVRLLEDSPETIEVVWKVEGLSDMLALHSRLAEAGLLGKHVVITNSQGTLETVKPEWIALLTGRTVHVIHDADRPGQIGAARWVQALGGRAKEVRNVQLGYEIAENHGKDIRDFFQDGQNIGKLLALAAVAPAVTDAHRSSLFAGEPPANGGSPTAPGNVTGQPDDVLGLIGLRVIGHDDKLKAIVFSEHGGVYEDIDTDKISHNGLIMICGQTAITHVCAGPIPADGQLTMSDVRLALSLAASQNRLCNTTVLGQGIWPADGQVILNNGTSVDAYVDGALQPVNGLRIGDHHIVEPKGAGDQWYDRDKMVDLLAQAGTPTAAQAVLEEVRTLFANWNWRHPPDAWTCALLVACTFTQTMWPWRPQVPLSGQSDAGKSTLLNTIAAIFGRLALLANKATEAGIRQAVRNRSCAIMIDEFEADAQRDKILELFRSSSQGGRKLTGTQDQKGMSFGLKHIPWMSATESGMIAEADINRCIRLDLKPLDPNKRGKFQVPGDTALAALGHRLCAVALQYHARAVELFWHLKGQQIDGVHGRIVESYSVPVSLRAAVYGLSLPAAVELLHSTLAGRGQATTPDCEHEQLKNAILRAVIDINRSSQRSVAQIINYPDAIDHAAMELMGLTLAKTGPGKRPALEKCTHLFVATDDLRTKLLRGTDWANLKKDLRQLLLRIEGAEDGRARIAGAAQVPGVYLPLGPLALKEQEGDGNAVARPGETTRTTAKTTVERPPGPVLQQRDSSPDDEDEPEGLVLDVGDDRSMFIPGELVGEEENEEKEEESPRRR
jgi:hypothetical protein